MLASWCPGPKEPRFRDIFGDAVSMMFGPVFPSPHLKKINDCKILVPILKKQRPRSDKRKGQAMPSALTTAYQGVTKGTRLRSCSRL